MSPSAHALASLLYLVYIRARSFAEFRERVVFFSLFLCVPLYSLSLSARSLSLSRWLALLENALEHTSCYVVTPH